MKLYCNRAIGLGGDTVYLLFLLSFLALAAILFNRAGPFSQLW